MLVSKNRWGNLMAICLMLSILGIVALIIPRTATAEIAVTVTGDGVRTETTFTQADLEAMETVQAHYSSINTYPTKKMDAAEGVKLLDLLTVAGIKDDAKIIRVTASDGYKMTFTRKELLDEQRYYYPGLRENHEYFGYIPGSSDHAVPVDTILALKNAEGDDFNDMNDSFAPVLMMGQRWVTEQSKNAFVKKVATIEVLTETPPKWENPTATPPGGTIAAATEVALSTSDMDGDSIYYTTDGSDPTVKSSMYNWVKKRWWRNRSDDLATINHPIVVSQDMTIKAVAIGFGKEDSDIVTFNYRVPAEVVFAIEGDSIRTKTYTMDDLKAMRATSKTYGAQSCTGVALRALLRDTEISDSNWTVTVNAADDSASPPIPVADVFDADNNYLLTYEIDGSDIRVDGDSFLTPLRLYYGDGSSSEKVYKHVESITLSKAVDRDPQYTVTPVSDLAYTTGMTPDGISTMTVNSGITGFKYFKVSVRPVIEHSGNEAVIFTHLRDGIQISKSVSKADFDQLSTAQAGFNVEANDVIKAYIVDDLSNSTQTMPVILQ